MAQFDFQAEMSLNEMNLFIIWFITFDFLECDIF